MAKRELLFGGIEGGGTQSTITLLDENGKILVILNGPSTNHWLLGMEECQNRIKVLVDEAKTAAGKNLSIPLQGLGLCLSGCEQEESNNELSNGLLQKFPSISESIYVSSDTIGSLSTGTKSGVILISGTGSNSLLMNPDGSTHQSGGWGYMIQEFGSAFWVANKAVQMIFQEDDNLIDPPYPTDRLRKLIFEHFQLKDRFGMLDHWFRNFEKPFYASLTAKISEEASKGDKMCAHLLQETGFVMGRYLSALSCKMNEEVFKGDNGLEVICVGSVFKSWNLMKDGFVRGTKPHCKNDREIPKITLYKLKVTSAVGASYQASRKYGYDLPKDYEQNRARFFVIKSDGTFSDVTS